MKGYFISFDPIDFAEDILLSGKFNYLGFIAGLKSLTSVIDRQKKSREYSMF